MEIKEKELFEIAEKIIKNNRKVLENFHTYADKKNHNDIGIEGWLQFELIAKLTEKGIDVDHGSEGVDLHFKDREDIELRATTSFHPCYVLDGFLDHGKYTVLFFSGFNKLYKKKNQPRFMDEKHILNCFKDYLKYNKRNKKLGKDSFEVEYKIMNLNKPSIIGLMKKSNEFKCI